MKTLRNLLTAVVLLVGTLTADAQSMNIAAIRSNARFLTDRMAYTLGIRDPFLIDEIYRINYDYIYGVNGYLDDIALGYYYDDYMLVCDARDIALRNLLGITVWNRLVGYSYFHRPIIFSNSRWHFGVYDHDRFGASYFHYAAPRPFGNGYAGGHFFGGMAPRERRGAATPPPATPRGGTPNRPGNAQPNHNANAQPNHNANAQPNHNANVQPNHNANAPVGGRSLNNMQSSSRATSTPSVSGANRSRSNEGMSSTNSNTGANRSSAGVTRSNAGAARSSAGATRSNAGATRSSAGGSRGGGRR